MIKAILFDFDGVILESADIKTQTFQKLFENDFPNYVDQIMAYHHTHTGISRFIKFKYFYENILKIPYTDDIEKELSRQFSEISVQEILNAPFVPGALEFLKKYYQDYLFFVASGSEENELKMIIRKRNLDLYFKEIHGGHRSKEMIINDIMNRYHFKKEELLFVGDALSDKIAAEKTNIIFIARINSSSQHPLSDCPHQVTQLLELDQFL